jgi:hypothetical protein
LFGGVDLALVNVDGQRAAIPLDGALEAILQTGELLIPVELGVWDQTGMIVEKSEEKDLALAVGVGRVGKVGTIHRVSLPQVSKVSPFEAAVGFGTLLRNELGGGGVAKGELAA